MFLLYTTAFGFEDVIFRDRDKATDHARATSSLAAYKTHDIQILTVTDLELYNADEISLVTTVRRGAVAL